MTRKRQNRTIRPILVANGCGALQLTKGFIGLIDLDDIPKVSDRNWRVTVPRDSGVQYVVGSIKLGEEHLGPVGHDVYLHRFLMKPRPDQVVDHDNWDGLDNRKRNLIVCSQSENITGERRR